MYMPRKSVFFVPYIHAWQWIWQVSGCFHALLQRCSPRSLQLRYVRSVTQSMHAPALTQAIWTHTTSINLRLRNLAHHLFFPFSFCRVCAYEMVSTLLRRHHFLGRRRIPRFPLHWRRRPTSEWTSILFFCLMVENCLADVTYDAWDDS